MGTLGVDGASQVAVEEVEGLLDAEHLLVGDVLADVVVVVVGLGHIGNKFYYTILKIISC